MTYPLGTTLIFTELAEAAAAARLFGKKSVGTLLMPTEPSDAKLFPGGFWFEGFLHGIQRYSDDDYTHDIDCLAVRWRIVLDTEEKVGWFRPQVGDKVQYHDNEYGAGRITNIIGVEKDLFICKDDPSTNIDPEEFELDTCFITRIHYRNGLPFPTPQEVERPNNGIVIENCTFVHEPQVGYFERDGKTLHDLVHRETKQKARKEGE